jgi:hypothetical protein
MENIFSSNQKLVRWTIDCSKHGISQDRIRQDARSVGRLRAFDSAARAFTDAVHVDGRMK